MINGEVTPVSTEGRTHVLNNSRRHVEAAVAARAVSESPGPRPQSSRNSAHRSHRPLRKRSRRYSAAAAHGANTSDFAAGQSATAHSMTVSPGPSGHMVAITRAVEVHSGQTPGASGWRRPQPVGSRSAASIRASSHPGFATASGFSSASVSKRRAALAATLLARAKPAFSGAESTRHAQIARRHAPASRHCSRCRQR